MKQELEEKNLVFRIIQKVKDRGTFSLNGLRNELNLNDSQFSFVSETLWWQKEDHPQNNSNHIFENVESVNIPKYQNKIYDLPRCLIPTALFQYIDYLDIVEVRKAAVASPATLHLHPSSGILCFNILKSKPFHCKSNKFYQG